jgi:hypothetical protein
MAGLAVELTILQPKRGHYNPAETDPFAYKKGHPFG